jgi:hypothetical protein
MVTQYVRINRNIAQWGGMLGEIIRHEGTGTTTWVQIETADGELHQLAFTPREFQPINLARLHIYAADGNYYRAVETMDDAYVIYTGKPHGFRSDGVLEYTQTNAEFFEIIEELEAAMRKIAPITHWTLNENF